MVGKVKVLLISSGNDGVGDGAIDNTVIPLKLYLKILERRLISRSLAAIVSYLLFYHFSSCCYFRARGIVLLFVLSSSQRVASHSCETSRELLHDP